MRDSSRFPYVVGLDVGTTKVAVVVAEASFPPRVVGVGHAYHNGLRHGKVIAVQETVSAIQKAVQDSEHISGVKIHSVYASLAGDHVRFFRQLGATRIQNETGEVTLEDCDVAMSQARFRLPQQVGAILSEIPHHYTVDGVEGITEPLGLVAQHLEIEMSFATASEQAVQTLSLCAEKAGLEVDRVLLDPLASASAVLTEEEKDAGVLMIDIGGGTSDYVLYYKSQLHRAGVVGLGGMNVTHDLSQVLRISRSEAESLKHHLGALASEEYGQVIEIAQARMEEIFEKVNEAIEDTGLLAHLGAGVVLTGGGANLDGCCACAELVFQQRAIRKQPIIQAEYGTLPLESLATGIGLVIQAVEDREAYHDGPHFGRNLMERFVAWFMRWYEYISRN